MQILVMLVMLLVLLPICIIGTNVTMCNDPNWMITFNDNFDVFNTSRWTVRNNMTHGPAEKQLYLANNVNVENGNLIITTKKEIVQSGRFNNTLYNYTSGWVDSKSKMFQKYGRFEVRAKLPSPSVGRDGKWPNAWPAHWLMPESEICWPMGGEIDIMEAYRPTPSGKGSMIMTYHWASKCGKDLYDGKNQLFPNKKNTTVIDWSNEYHTFGIEWSSKKIQWFVDGILKHERVQGQPKNLFIPSLQFYMILNTAMEPWSDYKVDKGLPCQHLIDRVTWCVPIND